jgi:holo-[acyl-carrier protein] synthase
VARLLKKNEELLRAVQRQVARERGSASPTRAATADPAERTSVNPAEGTSSDATPDVPAGPAQNASAVGLGVDLLEIDRMERAIARTPRILERVFTSGEREYAWSRARPAVHYATFFAAREAVLKALGSGFAGVNYADVEITHTESGKPEVLLHGKASALAEEQGITEVQVSLSHTHQMAVASAVAIKAQSAPPKTEATDPLEELARQFKELRVMLDDLGVNTAEATAEPDGREHDGRESE